MSESTLWIARSFLSSRPVKKVGSPSYVVDTTADGDHREAHVDIDDDRQIAEAIRTALKGRLKLS